MENLEVSGNFKIVFSRTEKVMKCKIMEISKIFNQLLSHKCLNQQTVLLIQFFSMNWSKPFAKCSEYS